MKKTTMKRIAAAVAALCICSMAIAPMAAYAGDIQITDATSVSVKGKEFTTYQIFKMETSGNAVKYVINEDWEDVITAQYNAYRTANPALNLADITVLSGDDYSVAVSTWMDHLKNNDTAYVRTLANALEAAIAADTTGKYDSVVYDSDSEGYVLSDDEKTVTLTLDDGYYLILDTTNVQGAYSANSASILKTTGDTPASITLKADKPTIEKKIWEDDGDKNIEDGELVDANNAYIGETVTYVLTGSIPDMSLYDSYFYQITDTLSDGLTYKGTTSVTVGGVDSDVTGAASGQTITYTFDDLKEYINEAGYDAAEGVQVIFTATVDSDAEIGTVGNPNEVYLTYSNDPSDTGTPDEGGSTGETPKDRVITYLTELKIFKMDQNGDALGQTGSGETLDGAIFSITSDDATQLYFKIDADGNVVAVDKDANDKYTAMVGTDGYITFTGLAAGTYTITEEKAPTGYNKLSSPITVTVTFAPPADVVNGTEECDWDFSANGATAIDETATYTVKVENKTGSLFPSTGGIGTTIFTVLGVSLMAGAAGAFAIKRKAMNK